MELVLDEPKKAEINTFHDIDILIDEKIKDYIGPTLIDGFKNIFSKKKLDGDVLSEFEDLLISADTGVDVAKELRKDFDSQFRDQTLINYNLFKNNYKFFPLETRFNGMEINGFSSRIENSNKTNAFIMHFAHEGDKAEQMRKVVEELEANNEDPIL